MNREEYLTLRRTNTVLPKLFYMYYEANAYTPTLMTAAEFHPQFTNFIQTQHPFDVNKIVAKIIRYFDTAFNISILMDKNSKIIKIY